MNTENIKRPYVVIYRIDGNDVSVVSGTRAHSLEHAVHVAQDAHEAILHRTVFRGLSAAPVMLSGPEETWDWHDIRDLEAASDAFWHIFGPRWQLLRDNVVEEGPFFSEDEAREGAGIVISMLDNDNDAMSITKEDAYINPEEYGRERPFRWRYWRNGDGDMRAQVEPVTIEIEEITPNDEYLRP